MINLGVCTCCVGSEKAFFLFCKQVVCSNKSDFMGQFRFFFTLLPMTGRVHFYKLVIHFATVLNDHRHNSTSQSLCFFLCSTPHFQRPWPGAIIEMPRRSCSSFPPGTRCRGHHQANSATAWQELLGSELLHVPTVCPQNLVSVPEAPAKAHRSEGF